MSTKAHAGRTNPRTTAAAGRKGRTGRPAGFSAVLEDALASVPDTERESFVLGVVGEDEDGLDRALWGPGPSPAERKAAALVNLRRQYQARRAVVEASLTRPEAAELLDVSEQAVLDRLKAGDLVGLKKGREWRLPSWQFSADSELGFVPGLARVSAVFAGGVVSLTEWALAPNSDLDGATPAEVLAAGHVDDVVRAARVGTAAAW
ncbi:helix-turn-helix domain-containing protein [Rhodococcus wratislaviensis]|uniref:Helix-turn-helix domain-containing protein n=1 Tax=Rhodococcus wratislaviensis NBRC 100605 TaxID=1219028 RepID=X0PYW5_RHOWR|nr:helix-turn-helix domain-containing protein [Rhodococcus wratislaviensis]GAF48819.1 hypothetical protein RW1_060_00280 [Rhodococcus wratislaviensis NBRC 100605]